MYSTDLESAMCQENQFHWISRMLSIKITILW